MMFSIIDDMDRRERDYSIDFVKGVAILFVILLHNMPNESIYSIAYIGQAVPLFLLVSSYLTYGGFQRKGFNGYFSARNVKKMLDRVSLPFFLLIFSQCAIFYLLKGVEYIGSVFICKVALVQDPIIHGSIYSVG